MLKNVKPKINSKSKGKRGELEVANILKKLGFTKAQRTEQYNGKLGEADVIGLDGLHIEVKRTEQLNIDKAMEQAENDSKNKDIPIVVHRKNGKKWKVTINLNSFIDILVRGYKLPETFNKDTYEESNKEK